MKYLSNFNSLEFGGKFHEFGEEIKVRKGEEGAIDVLVREGRVTAVADDDPKQPATAEAGEGGEAEPSAAEEAEENNEQPSLDGMTKAELVTQAEAEGVAIETDDNKADIISKIEAKRAGGA